MLKNKAEFNRQEISELFGNDSLINIPTDWKSVGVSIDSRQIDKQEMFVAIVGERTNGHDFVKAALSAGACAGIVSRSWFNDFRHDMHDAPLIVVDDTTVAFGQLAAHHRKRFNIPVLAIAGANGKTTTKNMTCAVMDTSFKNLGTYKNFNNQFGVPLMLLMLDSSYDTAVIEIGTNAPGEIEYLCNILQPTHGLITNIGREHLEKLKDLDGVEKEETALFRYLDATGGIKLVNIDDPRLKNYADDSDKCFIYGTNCVCNLQADIDFNEKLCPRLTFRFDGGIITINMKTIGQPSALNAIAATASGLALGVEAEDISNALHEFEQPSGTGYARMLIEDILGLSVINDCYNANPESMAAALETLHKYPSKGKSLAVLGDMRELGHSSLEEHLDILSNAAEKASKVMVTGHEMKKAFDKGSHNNIEYFEDKDDLLDALNKESAPGDVMLVKGSRGMHMETIIEKLKNKTES